MHHRLTDLARPLSAVLRIRRSTLGRRAVRWVCDRAAGRSVPRLRSDHGQTTAEYGLVILAAGSLALAAILWARNSGSITGLFQTVIDQLTGSIG